MDFEVNIKNKGVRIENLLNLNVPEPNKFKIEKKFFFTKIREISIFKFFTANSEIF